MAVYRSARSTCPANLDRRERLHAVIAALRERYGPHVIRTGAEIVALPAAPGDGPLTTGSLWLDLRTDGWPRGAISEVAGLDGAGKESLALAALVACQRAGGSVLLADLDGACDPDALDDAGVDIEQLIVACPSSAAAAWHILGAVGRCGALDLIVVFSLPGLLALPGSGWSWTAGVARGLRRLGTALRGGPTALLLTNHPLPGHAQDPAGGLWATVGGAVVAQEARLRVALEPAGVCCTPYGDIRALGAAATVVKHHGLAHGDGFPLEITAAGPRRAAELIALGCRLGLLDETPLGLCLDGCVLGRTAARAADALERDVTLLGALEARVRTAWMGDAPRSSPSKRTGTG